MRWWVLAVGMLTVGITGLMGMSGDDMTWMVLVADAAAVGFFVLQGVAEWRAGNNDAGLLCWMTVGVLVANVVVIWKGVMGM